MYKKLLDKYESVTSRKFNPRMAIAAIGVLVGIVLFVGFVTQPVRSVASYCKVYKEEETRLAKFPGKSWPSGTFNLAIGDAGEFVMSFDRLSAVAPDGIKSNVAILKDVYQKIHDDPSQAISASLSGGTADSELKAWTETNCKINVGQ
jgi:hypothetical protein